MKKGLLIGCGVLGVLLVIALIIFSWAVGIYNNLVGLNEEVLKAWSQVENQYQRRYDLIPNLVATVKGAADFERGTLNDVINARASVGQLKVTPEILENPQLFQKFQQAQDNLSSALSRLLVVVENYPQLKANENFHALQAQLEGTENRIAVERKRYNESVQVYNTTIKRFPAAIIANFTGYKEKMYFQAAAGAERAPEVKF